MIWLHRPVAAIDLRRHMLHAVRDPATPGGELTNPAPIPYVPSRDFDGLAQRVRVGRHTDFQRIEALNSALGLAGEKAVVSRERRRLTMLGREDLAKRVRHTSVVDGDGLGYDVLSFTPEGEKRFLEVKTTKYSEHQPFIVTRNEVAFSEDEHERFTLVRVFRFARPNLGFYELRGSLKESASLQPQSYSAFPRAVS